MTDLSLEAETLLAHVAQIELLIATRPPHYPRKKSKREMNWIRVKAWRRKNPEIYRERERVYMVKYFRKWRRKPVDAQLRTPQERNRERYLQRRARGERAGGRKRRKGERQC